MNFDRKELIRAALAVREKAYVPFSHFPVGAALLTADGKIYVGCNIENSSYTPTLCAERCAMAKAISEGERQFAAIAVVGSTEDYTSPCGVCRQFLYEFCDESLLVICAKSAEDFKEMTLGDLLPMGFRLKAN